MPRHASFVVTRFIGFFAGQPHECGHYKQERVETVQRRSKRNFALGVRRQARAIKRVGQQLRQLAGAKRTVQHVNQNDRNVRSELRQELATGSARRHATEARNRNRSPASIARCDRRRCRDAFGTDTQRITCVLDIATDDDLAVIHQQRGTHIEVTVRCIGLISNITRKAYEFFNFMRL